MNIVYAKDFISTVSPENCYRDHIYVFISFDSSDVIVSLSKYIAEYFSVSVGVTGITAKYMGVIVQNKWIVVRLVM